MTSVPGCLNPNYLDLLKEQNMTIKNVAARLKETAGEKTLSTLMGKAQRLLREAKGVLDEDVRSLLEEAIIELDEAGKSSRKANQYVDELEDLIKTLEVRISNVGTFTRRWSQILDDSSVTAAVRPEPGSPEWKNRVEEAKRRYKDKAKAKQDGSAADMMYNEFQDIRKKYFLQFLRDAGVTPSPEFEKDLKKVSTAATEEVASPITVGLGQKALADKIASSLGLTVGSLGFEILAGGLAYVLSDPARRKGQPDELSAQVLRRALLANKVLINKLIGELNDDLGSGK